MSSRSNAIAELTRFWLQARHKCLVDESLPVPVRYGLSDIDLIAIRCDSSHFTLTSGVTVGPRLIVETKDEHDWEPKGIEFGKSFKADIEKMQGEMYVPAKIAGVKFTMLRQQHFEIASNFFGTNDFDRLFVVHAMEAKMREEIQLMLTPAHRIHILVITELVEDLRKWYVTHQRPSGLRNTLTGDIWHLLIGFCKYGPTH